MNWEGGAEGEDGGGTVKGVEVEGMEEIGNWG